MSKKQTRSFTNQLTATMETAPTAKNPVEVTPAAKKQQLEEVASTSKKQQPESPSDDEEMESEEDGEEAETDSSSEEEDEPKPGKNPQTPPAIVAATVIERSDSESGSETESGESDSETKPASTKPASTEPASTEPPPPVASPRTLRKRTIEVAGEQKRAKTESETETAKKVLFVRVWSEEDEIALLQGMLKFKTETRKNPSDDYHALYETVKESNYLEDKSFNQFYRKIGGLKEKYWKKKKTYKKAHDLKCSELCKKIWGTYLVSSTTAAVKSKKKNTVEVDSDWFERSNLIGHLTKGGVVDEVAVKEKWSKVSVKMKKKLEEKWKVLQEADFRGLRLRSELVFEVSSAISNA